MRYLKLITAAVMALAVISALTAGAAFGAQAEGFLPTTNKFIGTGLGGKLETLGGKVTECGKTTITAGTYETDSHGKATIEYSKCKAFGLFTANSLGDKSEIILAPSTYLLCLITPQTLEYGVFIELTTPIHVEAAGKLLTLAGGIIGKIVENTASLKKTLTFKASKGDSEPKTCTGVEGKVKEANLTLTEDGGKAESSGFTGTATIESEDKVTKVEIMDGN